MGRDSTSQLLSQTKPELQSRFGVIRWTLLGSTARDQASTQSDVDLLVAFDRPATSQRYFGVQSYRDG